MHDFRLKVFLTVAQRLSFTKAADELFISQPAVSKHIKEIEKHYQQSLFERKGNHLELTPTGFILKKYATQISSLYQKMDSEIRFREEKHHGIIKIGASTTAAQYVLPKYLAQLRSRYPQMQLQLGTGNTEKIETLLLNNEIDLAVVEGKSKRRLKYLPFLKDEIVLCTHVETLCPPILKAIHELENFPFVFRENGSGTLEIIRSALLKKNIKLDNLKVEMVLENNESIKSYLQNSHAFAFISIAAIANELLNNKLKIIDIENFSMDRYFYIATKSEVQNPLIDVFIKQLLDNQ